jgi:ABC-type lipoprotein export system ATPase subunit
MIALTDVEFRYPGSEFCLRVPEMVVSRGATVALIGPSGSGKTTILNLIAGILVPSTGRISTNTVNLSELGDNARRAFRIQNIGLVFQEFELIEHLSVLDNILLPCRITPAIQLQQTHRDRAAELAGEVGLADKLRRYVRKLSQGERQRVALCRALLLEPPLLLCDEPTGNLDPVNKAHVLKILFDYVSRHGTTLLTVTHDYELLSQFDETIDCKKFHASSETPA